MHAIRAYLYNTNLCLLGGLSMTTWLGLCQYAHWVISVILSDLVNQDFCGKTVVLWSWNASIMLKLVKIQFRFWWYYMCWLHIGCTVFMQVCLIKLWDGRLAHGGVFVKGVMTWKTLWVLTCNDSFVQLMCALNARALNLPPCYKLSI